MSDPILLEEFEVLESIYPTEITKTSEREIIIDVEPEDLDGGHEPMKLSLNVSYPENYPDVLPDLSLEPVDGDFSEQDLEALLSDMMVSGEESIGMAMTFTLVAVLKDKMTDMIQQRVKKKVEEEKEKERREIEAEEARTRGTPVTLDSFKTWKAKFDHDMAIMKAKEEDEKMKGMSAKEKEEYRRIGTRLSGRQLFERDMNLDVSDESFTEEGTVSVDFSQYDRTRQEEEEEERITFSDDE